MSPAPSHRRAAPAGSGGAALTRIAVFYDGNYFWRISNYYKHRHPRASYLSLDGLHTCIRQRVAELETGGQLALAQIVESHFFRGRFSLKSVQGMSDPLRQLEADRFQDQILMHAGIVAHYHPMNETVSPPEEKGIDVWMALEAYDLAVHRPFDVLALITGDSDFVPLVRKISALGTRVMIVGANLDGSARTSQRLVDEAAYTLMLSSEIDADSGQHNPVINGLFR